MSRREDFNPGPANLARVHGREGVHWTLVLVKDLRHAPEKVWEALTDPAQLREWSPLDASRNMGEVGPVTLTTVGMPGAPDETEVVRAERPRVLEYLWGGRTTRWELEATAEGTRLTLWASIDRRFIAMGAAGWHVCVCVMEQLIDGDPVGRIVSEDALKFGDWQRLHAEYSQQFGVESPSW